jgi:very-short-patch-repair endonuclease
LKGGVGEAPGWLETIMRNTANYLSLPFNPKLRERAKALRKAGNLSEVLVWQQLHKRKFKSLDFDRQKIIGNYIVDFFCANCRVVIEVDGSSHDENHEYDRERDVYLEGLGLTVIHVLAVDVLNRLEEVMLMLRDHPAFRESL